MIDLSDKLTLMENAAFRRFLFALIRTAGVFETSATAGDGRALYLEGRRGLALEVLRELEEGQGKPSPSGIPVHTLIQTLREEVQSAPMEKKLGRRNDPYSDLGPEHGTGD
ncbi:hypothetical protein G4G27_15140 [Sphingomonas sp. So64.6b]|uniref:Bbp19 family protein n=1 Tax=Sphingomonas sp. So64.6b TaxID=2997354 RepID=UPI0015FECF15|nr:hypothetical protein [Sphingomonas sp. So64.6b]QNA85183.1 hypothetical protein G4G27_15140 [Sphingomonas sp. So64.6b]